MSRDGFTRQELDLLRESRTETRTVPVVLNRQGEARETFVDELDRWDRQMEDLQAAQKWLHAIVTTGHANYSAAARATLRGWGGA
ncbi:WXG100 family type VII secretion target [Streptomyces sp. SBR177]